MDIQYVVKPLDRRHDRAAFSCGVEPLDLYLKQRARDDAERGVSAAYVFCDGATIIGYYTLSMASVQLSHIPESEIKRLPRYPLPVALLGKLAVNSAYQKQRFGERLLMDAFNRCIEASVNVACFAVMVEAIDDSARAFYERYGFIRFVDAEYKLFLPLTTIRRAFPKL